MESTDRAMSSACDFGPFEHHVLHEVRNAVLGSLSTREPVPIQMPSETERT